MAYSSLDDLRLRAPEEVLIRLSDDAKSGQLDQALIEAIIQEVDALIDSYIQVQVSLPLASVPRIIQSLSADLALHRLYARRGLEAPKGVEEPYRQGQDFLRMILEGKITITPGLNLSVVEGLLVNSQEKRFTRSYLERF